jgi:hypothetical protein
MAEEESKPKPYIWTLILIGSFVVATVSAGYIGYWLGTQEQSISKVSTPAWRTYTDRNLNFSFSYHANWSGEITKEGYLIFKGPADEKGHVPNIIVQVMRPAKCRRKLLVL